LAVIWLIFEAEIFGQIVVERTGLCHCEITAFCLTKMAVGY
jgi:hypothetical protein